VKSTLGAPSLRAKQLERFVDLDTVPVSEWTLGLFHRDERGDRVTHLLVGGLQSSVAALSDEGC
jgi:hypothetical protein